MAPRALISIGTNSHAAVGPRRRRGHAGRRVAAARGSAPDCSETRPPRSRRDARGRWRRSRLHGRRARAPARASPASRPARCAARATAPPSPPTVERADRRSAAHPQRRGGGDVLVPGRDAHARRQPSRSASSTSAAAARSSRSTCPRARAGTATSRYTLLGSRSAPCGSAERHPAFLGAARARRASSAPRSCGERARRCDDRCSRRYREAPRPGRLIVVGGTAFTAAAMVARGAAARRRAIIDRRPARALLDELLARDLDARKALPFIRPQRADIFPAGIAIIDEACRHAAVADVTRQRRRPARRVSVFGRRNPHVIGMMVELADTADLKSAAREGIRVRASVIPSSEA